MGEWPKVIKEHWLEWPRAVGLEVDPGLRALCARPYPGHPKGCPNFGKKAKCPPRLPLLDDVLDMRKPVWIVWNVFDMKSHVERMRLKHPAWSDRQLRCCLYWQAGARKELMQKIRWFGEWLGVPDMTVCASPEGCGVNVTEMMKAVGEDLEWPPVSKAYQVALVGFRARSSLTSWAPYQRGDEGEDAEDSRGD
jgi:hypothetical protein